MSELIRGRIEKVFRVKSSTWFAGIIRLEDTWKTEKIAGPSEPHIVAGTRVECNASYEYESGYGWEYKVDKGSVIRRILTSREEIVSWLSCGAFGGIGRETAEKIYDRYGSNTMVELEEDPERCADECGLKKIQKDSLKDGINQNRAVPKLMQLMPDLDINAARRIANNLALNETAEDVFKEAMRHPYGTLRGSFGLSFYAADKVAMKDLGVSEFSTERVCAVLDCALAEFMHDNNAAYVRLSDTAEWQRFFDYNFMQVKMYTRFPISVDGYRFDAGCLAMMIAGWDAAGELEYVTVKSPRMHDGAVESALYRRRTAEAEDLLSGFLAKSAREGKISHGTRPVLQSRKGWNMLNAKQRDAVCAAFEYRVSFISGGPGRGKTTALRFLSESWLDSGRDLVMLAPTGKAVNRLKEQTDFPNAETVARFLTRARLRKDGAPLTDASGTKLGSGEYALVIVDEVSMMTMEDMADLIDLLPLASYVFVGDADQLPAIGGCAFLEECAELAEREPDIIHMTFLTDNFRTSVPELNDNANAIRDGRTIRDLKITGNFMMIPADENAPDGKRSAAESYIVDHYRDLLAQGASFEDIMVLTPFSSNKYPLSAPRLNRIFQEELNPERNRPLAGQLRDELGFYFEGRGIFSGIHDADGNGIRIGDRIMNSKNMAEMEVILAPDEQSAVSGNGAHSDLGVYNGDSGTVVRFYDTRCSDPFLLVRLDGEHKPDDGTVLYRYVFVKPESSDNDKSDNVLKTWTLAYAVTVHKAQGSEAGHVIATFSEKGRNACEWRVNYGGTPFLVRNLLYTAVTRAKEDVFIVGSRAAVEECMGTEYKRGNSYLAEAIRGKARGVV